MSRGSWLLAVLAAFTIGLSVAAEASAGVQVFDPGLTRTATGITADGGNGVWVADAGGDRALHVSQSGGVLGSLGHPGTGDGEFDVPMDVVTGADGAVFVVDFGGQLPGSTTSRLQKFASSGAFEWSRTVPFQGTSSLTAGTGGDIWAVEPNPRHVTRYQASDGTQTGQFSAGGAGFPSSVVVGDDGNLLLSITDGSSSSEVDRVTPTGAGLGTFASGLGRWAALARAPDGAVIAASQDGQVRRYSAGGTLLGTWKATTPDGQDAIPIDVAVSADGAVWIPVNILVNNACCTVRLMRLVPGAPDAAIHASDSVLATGETVSLDASASRADLAQVTQYEWDLDGDGTFETNTGGDPHATARFDSPGSRTVSVRVTSSTGATSTASTTVEARPASPPGPVGVSINGGAQFTNDPHVVVSARWPRLSQQLFISNDGGFANAQQRPVAAEIPWTLDSSGPERLPKTIYVRFDGSGTQTFQDDIILDQTAPVVSSATGTTGPTAAASAAGRSHRVVVRVKAHDNLSGVSAIQLTANKRRAAAPQRYRARVTLKTSASRLFVRVRDGAGNFSRWRTIKVRRAAAGRKR